MSVNALQLVSIIVPCYNEEESIPLFLMNIVPILEELPNASYEIIFIDDGSQDKTLRKLKEEHSKNPNIKYLSFSRNFGKESALFAGLEKSRGDYVAVMDADLQDPPILLKEMYQILLEEEYDCVATARTSRVGEPPIRSWFAKRFYSLINRISHVEIKDGARDYRLMTKQMVNSIISLREYNRFSKGIFSWVGYNIKWLTYENLPRAAGETKWSFIKLLKYAISGVVGFSILPLSIATFTGLFFFLLSMLGILVVVIRWIFIGDPVAGWPSLVSIILFASGLQLLCIGIIGEYIAKIYLEVKERPIYLIKESSYSEQ